MESEKFDHELAFLYVDHEEGTVVWEVQHVQFFGVQTFLRSFTIKFFPDCLIMKTVMKTYLFFGTDAFKIPC